MKVLISFKRSRRKIFEKDFSAVTMREFIRSINKYVIVRNKLSFVNPAELLVFQKKGSAFKGLNLI